MMENEVEGFSNRKSFYGNFETTLWRFWNPWYFTEVLKPTIFNRGRDSERLSLRLKITIGNTFPRDGLVGEITTLGKWLNRGFNLG